MSEPALGEEFFARPVGVVARDLLGCTLEHEGVGGVIVEVERYQEDDPASHSHGGPRGRNTVMFGPPGRAYVYRSYGVHWCLNLVCGPAGTGAAVLLRALEPRTGLERMRARRGPVADRLLCAGPGRLAQALGVDASLNGVALSAGGPLRVLPAAAPVPVVRGPRIGISRAADRPWRLGVAGSAYLSRPFPRAA